MDIALVLEHLIPSAEYFGSTTDNSEISYNELVWNDKRKKPKWSELINAQSTVEDKWLKKNKVEELIQKEMRKKAIDDLKANGKIDNKGEITEAGLADL